MRRRLVLPAALLTAAALGACGGAASSGPAASGAAPVGDAATADRPAGGIRLVDVAEARTLAGTPGVTIIDVRTPEEFAAGHLAGAVLVDVSAPGFAEAIGAFDRNGRYLVYCRSGNRTQAAVAAMARAGFTDVAELDGGILSWQAAGLPLTRG